MQTWLELYGDGYREVVKRCSQFEKQTVDNNEPFSKLKKKYPMYFWPELLGVKKSGF